MVDPSATPPELPSRDELLARYDAQLRAELASADVREPHGPVTWGVYRGGRGFVTYRDLGGLDAAGIEELVDETFRRYAEDPSITRVEWKTRGHDHAPGLHDALVARGFVPGEWESVMVGPAAPLTEVSVPEGICVRRVTSPDDVEAMCACADEGFGESLPGMAQALLHRLSLDDGMELWVAEADGRMVGTGRLEPVAGTDFAGLWGGATVPAWRGRGVYRTLLAARARSALQRGHTLLQSDSTEDSRPILERSGFVRITTTTPYEWHRP
ncbi:GNAT family N-acetyltransferase [Arsenicicoccus dermatophilus]|uniref:GNAT family N-acetyltransferase n=1 Tax=Arsenicicoccus dermatophilus TaxID=1076331 RepID=UPI001F4CA90A|nr:GNAT family N-acetyltransferase [Arsenicicoccus dermatophilus]MCH8612445.1 GNAT family N-acetyltransferase [Arsenicicoccus dermatophilus]